MNNNLISYLKSGISLAGILLTASVSGQSLSTPSTENYSIADRGATHRTWRKTVESMNPATGTMETHTSQYVELADGLHYWDGEWKESQDLIEIVGNNAVARHGPHRVIFAGNINSEGVIDLQAANGQRFRSHILGLFYFDAASGLSVPVARVKDSVIYF